LGMLAYGKWLSKRSDEGNEVNCLKTIFLIKMTLILHRSLVQTRSPKHAAIRPRKRLNKIMKLCRNKSRRLRNNMRPLRRRLKLKNARNNVRKLVSRSWLRRRNNNASVKPTSS